TRWPRDWSSDVCSSDLEKVCERGAANGRTSRRDGSSQIIPRVVIDARTTTVSSSAREGRHKENRRSVYRCGLIATRCMINIVMRSEERRVGKECSSCGE